MKIEYNNLYTHIIFTTHRRLPLIEDQHRIRIEKFMTGVINNYESKLYAIYANPEHVHILASRSPSIAEETLATIVADATARFINENKLCQYKFDWQQSDVDRVHKYILNQPIHHRKITFAEEFDGFIKFYQKGLRWNM